MKYAQWIAAYYSHSQQEGTIYMEEGMNNEGNVAARNWPAGDLKSAPNNAVCARCQAGNANSSMLVDLYRYIYGTQIRSKLLPYISAYL